MALSVKKSLLLASVVGCAAATTAHAQTVSMTYRAEQAAAGKAVYEQHCQSCHGASLDDGEFGPPLRGSFFLSTWGGKLASELMDNITTKMPAAAPGSLSNDEYTNVFAYMMQKNTVFAGPIALPSEFEALKNMILPSSQQAGGIVGGLTAGVPLPTNPEPLANPLAKITPVTEAMLRNPPEGDWLTWRRTMDAQGFSPLKQINKANVERLQVAWSWAMPAGPNEATPLIHDGVMFVQGYGDIVQALNAATGDLLWQYTRRLPKGVNAGTKKAMSIFGDRLYMPTSDARIVALDVKTGSLVWETESVGKGISMSGGPLIAKGKVIVGTGGQGPGGNFILGYDMKTGKESWRFKTISEPGKPEVDTWNNLPMDKRSGGSVWTPGSYDPVSNLVYFGPAPTYDTGPLRNRVKEGNATNEALYTNATVALNPETGKVVWFYSHLPNDQWDLDWAFERQIVTLPVKGKPTRVVVTAGKPMIFEGLEAATGKYVFSKDLGLQNFITAIDPVTGAKTIDPTKVPGDGEIKFVCPHSGGGKNWQPSSYNPDTKILYATMVETCMNLTPVGPGERGAMTTGVQWSVRPIVDSDGRYGRLQAINLETKETVWVDRQRAPRASGTLATAGGLVFSGDVRRVFSAYDDATGKKLWSTRLNDVPNSNPVTYTVNGKQYVAMVVGNGGPQTVLFAQLVPEIKNPPNRAGTVWVFEVPDAR